MPLSRRMWTTERRTSSTGEYRRFGGDCERTEQPPVIRITASDERISSTKHGGEIGQMNRLFTQSANTPNKQNAVTGRIFFLDLAGGRVMSAKPDGTDLQEIAESVGKLPDGLAVDVA